jgi:hypothetical protein
MRLNGVAVTAGQMVSAADIAAGAFGYTPALNGNGLTRFTFSKTRPAALMRRPTA